MRNRVILDERTGVLKKKRSYSVNLIYDRTPMPANQWIKSNDFLKTTFQISVKNVTTHTSVADEAMIDLIEVNDRGLVLMLPKTVGALGHLLLIKIVRKQSQSLQAPTHSVFNFTGKITAIDALETGSSAISLQFYQFNEEEWKSFLKECAERQLTVNSIVKKVQD